MAMTDSPSRSAMALISPVFECCPPAGGDVVTAMSYYDYMEVGVRDLKARLSEYLERVENGEIINVTSRGRPIAQLVPIPGRGNIERGLAEGWISRLEDRPPEPVVRQRPVPGTRTTTELIREDRDA